MKEGLRTIYLKLESIRQFEGPDERNTIEECAKGLPEALLSGRGITGISNVEVLSIVDSYRKIDEFEVAGFSEDICEDCRKIRDEYGIPAENIISLLKTVDNFNTKSN